MPPLTYVIDPLVIDREEDRYRPGSRRLAYVCDHYGVDGLMAHLATSDALAAVRLARAMMAFYPRLPWGDAAAMMAYQQEAYRRWALSYSDWLFDMGHEDKAIAVKPNWI